jgi:hypothetical protein
MFALLRHKLFKYSRKKPCLYSNQSRKRCTNLRRRDAALQDGMRERRRWEWRDRAAAPSDGRCDPQAVGVPVHADAAGIPAAA